MKAKAKRSSLDRISNLPSSIIETILCLLPIQQAARTSILSKEWRYSWTKIPKLVFIEREFEFSSKEHELSILEKTFRDPPSDRKEMSWRCQFFSAIYQVLLVHQGPIVEFVLRVDADETCVEIDQIIAHLSRNNAVKKFMLDGIDYFYYKVPLSIFSLHQLTHLHLQTCDIKNLALRPTSSGFVNLTNLHLENVDTGPSFIKTIIHLISKSPLLKSFTWIITKVDLDYVSKTNDLTIYDLFKFLPMIEHLTISFLVIEFFHPRVLPRELPTSLVHLKDFCFKEMCFDATTLRFLLMMIRSSPNLEKLELQILTNRGSEESFSVEDYSDIWLEHLIELKIEDFENLKHQLKFVKLILAKSPMLKKVRILLDRSVAVNKELKVKKLLLRSPCASHLVDIIVEQPLLLRFPCASHLVDIIFGHPLKYEDSPSEYEDSIPEDDDSSPEDDDISQSEDENISLQSEDENSSPEDEDSSQSEDEDSS